MALLLLLRGGGVLGAEWQLCWLLTALHRPAQRRHLAMARLLGLVHRLGLEGSPVRRRLCPANDRPSQSTNQLVLPLTLQPTSPTSWYSAKRATRPVPSAEAPTTLQCTKRGCGRALRASRRDARLRDVSYVKRPGVLWSVWHLWLHATASAWPHCRPARPAHVAGMLLQAFVALCTVRVTGGQQAKV